MNYAEVINILQDPQVRSIVVRFQAECQEHHATKAQLTASREQNHEFRQQTLKLAQQLENMTVEMHERDDLKAASIMDSKKIQELQKQLKKVTDEKEACAEKIQELEIKLVDCEKEKTKEIWKLREQQGQSLENVVERWRTAGQAELERHEATKSQLAACQTEKQELQQKTDALVGMLKQAKEEITELMDRVNGFERATASLVIKIKQHEASKKESSKLQEQHAMEIEVKDLKIQELKTELEASEKENAEKIQELPEQNAKEIEELKNQLAASKEELQKQNDKVQKLQNEKLETDRGLHQIVGQLEELVKKQEPTQLHTELGKLYMELQEAKKPQLALMAQLTAKNAEVVHLEAMVQQLSDQVNAMEYVKQRMQEADQAMKKCKEQVQKFILAKQVEQEKVAGAAQLSDEVNAKNPDFPIAEHLMQKQTQLLMQLMIAQQRKVLEEQLRQKNHTNQVEQETPAEGAGDGNTV